MEDISVKTAMKILKTKKSNYLKKEGYFENKNHCRRKKSRKSIPHYKNYRSSCNDGQGEHQKNMCC